MRTTAMTTILTALALILPLAVQAGEFPDDWFWDRPEAHTDFEGSQAPGLTVGEWVGGDFDIDEDMQGQIVVIDFWATWCGPCIAAMPHNTELAKEYADQGVKLIGVCTSGDAEQMPKIVADNGAEYPNAFAAGKQVETDWPIQWYPTYAVVDRQGVVRAIGLKPDKVADVIDALLDEDAADGTRPARIRDAWLEGDSEKRARLKKLEDKADTPPALQVENWINSEPLALEDLKGKVVVLDFWATWCGPCIRAIPHHNELMTKHAEDGLVIIGVTATHGGEALEATVAEHGIAFPVAVDIDNKTNTAYGPNGYPDYYLIDRAGNLRIADCKNASLDDAIAALLSEPVPDVAADLTDAAQAINDAVDAATDTVEEAADAVDAVDDAAAE